MMSLVDKQRKKKMNKVQTQAAKKEPIYPSTSFLLAHGGISSSKPSFDIMKEETTTVDLSGTIIITRDNHQERHWSLVIFFKFNVLELPQNIIHRLLLLISKAHNMLKHWFTYLYRFTDLQLYSFLEPR
jgi:hypothetical protein